MRRVMLMMLLSVVLDARAQIEEVAPRDGVLAITWHADSLGELRLASSDTELKLRGMSDQRLRLRRGQLDALLGAAFDVTSDLSLRLRGKRIRIDQPRLVVRDAIAFEFALVDRKQGEWLRFGHAQPQQRQDGDVAEWRHFDVRIGRALAAHIGDRGLVGVPLASATLTLRLAHSAKVLLGCATPNFPQPGNGFTIDVALTDLMDADATCNGHCTGNGAALAQVKLTPSAKLQGVGNADAPWYEKFMVSPHAYPYAGNDQHPMLVWAAYRINALGQIEQIARSGAKHAFYSGNQFPNGDNGCGCGPANVLWAGCTDTYGWSTNDSSAYLAPRHEIIPARGQWGRCNSFRDANCDGADDLPFYSTFDHRAVTSEANITPALNPGATWFIEAWYVVRDDTNLPNSLGHRRFVPSWSPLPSNKWMLSFYETVGDPLFPFVSGPVLDQWVTPGSTSATSMSRDLATSDGHVRLSVKVASLGDGRYRYDYALMNFDFARAVTTGTEPNLRVLSNLGLGALSIPIASNSGASVDMHQAGANAWDVTYADGALRIAAPNGDSQPWGALYRFSLTTRLPPEAGAAVITPAAFGTPATLNIGTLVPSTSEVLFASGFE